MLQRSYLLVGDHLATVRHLRTGMSVGNTGEAVRIQDQSLGRRLLRTYVRTIYEGCLFRLVLVPVHWLRSAGRGGAGAEADARAVGRSPWCRALPSVAVSNANGAGPSAVPSRPQQAVRSHGPIPVLSGHGPTGGVEPAPKRALQWHRPAQPPSAGQPRSSGTGSTSPPDRSH
jgi:hypothetical protein